MEKLLDSCPDCGQNSLVESVETGEFQYGHRRPVSLKATAPMLSCTKCQCQVADWRMEQARALAVSEHFKAVGPQRNHPEMLELWHRLGSNHRLQIEHDARCGCFYCLSFFESKEIDSWIDEGQTALCPKCGIKSVLPAAEDLTAEFLKQMQQYWFAAASEV